MYRYYSSALVDHLYTTTFQEQGCGLTYNYEGAVGYLPRQAVPGAVALYRFFNGSDHFYSTDPTGEMLPGYTFEGAIGFVFLSQVAGTVPLYRYYLATFSDHLYTTDPNETFPPNSYVFESITGYIYASPADGVFPCVPSPSITEPANNAHFELLDSDFTSATVSFKGFVPGGFINWILDTTYTTSGGVGPFTSHNVVSTFGYNTPGEVVYTGVGGKVTLQPSCEVCSVTETLTIAGPESGIPDNEITTRLVALYADGATPNLLTGVAQVESTYAQFKTIVLFSKSAKWPNENFPTRNVPAGTHIGLMQVKPADYGIGAAFSWVENTADGVTLFRQKLTTAGSYENQIIASHAGLRHLDGFERERMATLLYGPGASSSLTKQYYAPACIGGSGKNCNGDHWDWTVNSSGNAVGVDYVANVLANLH
jgi:hypothetical protein